MLADEEQICLTCIYHLPFTDFHTDAENETARQLWGKLSVEYATSMLHLAKSSRVEKLLHKLKYGNEPQIGVLLGKLYADKLGKVPRLTDIDAIVPVPIHKKKLRKRGYNQAAVFARGISQAWGKQYIGDLLIRRINSASQVTKKRAERYDNVEGVFAINQGKFAIENRHILLVDDVLTTGATICEAGNLLIKQGARVSVATIARA